MSKNIATTNPELAKKEYPVLDAGIYTVEFEGGEVKEMKGGKGSYYNAAFKFISEREELKDRKVWKMFTLTYEGNDEYPEWGANALQSFLTNSGVVGGLAEVGFDPIKFPTDVINKLAGVKLNVELKVQPGKGAYGPQNQIKKFMRMN